MVWYVNRNLGANGNGTSLSPYNTLAPFNTTGASNPSGSGDFIFLYGSAGSYAGGAALKTSQTLQSQSLDLTVAGNTLLTASGSNATITNSGGTGVTLGEGSTVKGISVDTTSGAGIASTNVNTFTLDSTDTIANNTGNALDINAGNGTITIPFAITSSSAHSISIQNRAGGTITLPSAITDTGTGILLNTNTGATITFTGGLTITTGANPAFTATGGGTINATGSPNTLTTTTGTALNVTNTTIGASGLTFKSISAGTAATGPTNGIVLNNTGSSGGLTVTGNGGNCTPADQTCTGGTIQHTGSHGLSLTSASNIALNRMSIHDTGDHGVFGNGVAGFTLRDSIVFNFGNATPSSGPSEDALHFESTDTTNTAAGHGLTGTVVIQRDTIGPDGHFTLTPNPPLPENKGIVIRNHNDATLSMTVTGTTFTQISNDGIDGDFFNGGATLNVDGSTGDGANNFTQINGRAVSFMNGTDNTSDQTLNLTIKNNTFDKVGIGGHWVASARGTMNAVYTNNTMTNTTNDAIRSESDASVPVAGHPATVNATVTGNTMGGGSVFISNHRSSIQTMTVSSNTNIGGTPAGVGGSGSLGVHTGINIRSDRGSTINMDFLNNVGTADGSLAQAQSALDFQATNNGGGNSTICGKVSSNTLTENPDTAGQQVISIDPVDAGTSITFEGGPGGSPGTENYLAANNTLNGITKVAISTPSRVPSGVGVNCVP
jgi:hypothetical protein